MAMNTNKTKRGAFGKVDKLLARPKIRTERATGERSLEREIGNRGDTTLGSVKREKVKMN